MHDSTTEDLNIGAEIKAFRAAGHALVDQLASYWASLETRDVSPAPGEGGTPGDVLRALPEAPPEQGGEAYDAMLGDLDRLITPALLHWQSPRFFGFFPANASFAAILGEFASAGLNVNGMNWATSPAATELETRMLDWFADLLALPERFRSTSEGGGVIQGTASEATLVALCAARARAVDAGVDPASLCVYTSEQAHSSVLKAAMIAGLASGPEDRARVRLIETDADLRMDAGALEHAMRVDVEGGRAPAFVCATLGTTGTEAVDPIPEIAGLLDALGGDAPVRPWLHVDAAYTGAALVCPEHRGLARGVERADSICINPHKWLLVNFDCDLFWVADRAALVRALSVTPEYLRNDASDAGAVIDYRDWQVPLGRRMRALKLWFVARRYGAEGMRAHVRRHVELAKALEARVLADDRFELLASRTTSLVCLGVRAGDNATQRARDERGAGRRVFVSHTRVPSVGGEGSRLVIRIAIGATLTEARRVDELWEELSRASDAALA